MTNKKDLIALAGEMLAALKEIRCYGDHYQHRRFDKSPYKMMVEAIAKADATGLKS